MSKKKNQHFVPSFHLRGFAIDGKSGSTGLIWEYDKQCPNAQIKQKSIRKAVCGKPFYYEQTDKEGTRPQSFEDALGKVEQEAAKIIRDLHEKRELTSKGKLAFYIALLLCRGPAFRDGCGSLLEGAIEASLQQLRDNGRLPPMLQACLKDGNLKSIFDVDVFPQATLQPLVAAATQIGESLCRKKWEFFISSGEDYFVTSDTPVIFGPGRGDYRAVGPGHPNALVWCPLRKDILVGIRQYLDSDRCPYEIKTATKEHVAKINQLMCFAAQRYVYAPVKNKELEGYVKDTKDYSQLFAAFPVGQTVVSGWGIRHKTQNGTTFSS